MRQGRGMDHVSEQAHLSQPHLRAWLLLNSLHFLCLIITPLLSCKDSGLQGPVPPITASPSLFVMVVYGFLVCSLLHWSLRHLAYWFSPSFKPFRWRGWNQLATSWCFSSVTFRPSNSTSVSHDCILDPASSILWLYTGTTAASASQHNHSTTPACSRPLAISAPSICWFCFLLYPQPVSLTQIFGPELRHFSEHP